MAPSSLLHRTSPKDVALPINRIVIKSCISVLFVVLIVLLFVVLSVVVIFFLCRLRCKVMGYDICHFRHSLCKVWGFVV